MGKWCWRGRMLLALQGLTGCGMDVLHPAGPVAVQEGRLLVETTAAMLIVVIPVFVMTIVFAWRYRAGAPHSRYDPAWVSSLPVEIAIWGIPFAIVVFLSVVAWRLTLALDPFKPLPGNAPALLVDVVAMDWKWLFIYPDQHIATINRLVIPAGTQIAFKITSGSVMNVFFIPRLGTQIYAMAGMQTQDHLLAKNPGDFRGLSANFSGDGFARMQFDTTAVTPAAFAASWLFTIFRGRLCFTVPILWSLGFIITFTIGGMTGVILAIPGNDYVLHNSLFLVAHFHNVLIGGVLFGMLAGYNYWFPKALGFTLNEAWGKAAFWFWITGFYIAFMPLYVLGFMGMTRRLDYYDNIAWQPYLVLAFFGAILIMIGIVCQAVQLYVSVRNRAQHRDLTGDPWNGRTLEWSVASPPPFYNFAVTPHGHGIDAFWDYKEAGPKNAEPAYADIHMPKNTVAGFIIGVLGGVLAFGLIWHIWWLAIAALLGMVIAAVARAYQAEVEYILPAAEIARFEGARRA